MNVAPGAAVVPQTGTARMIRDVVRADAGAISATAVIAASHPLVVAGEAPAYLGIEVAAQAAAALAALTAGAGGEPRAIAGRLVRIYDASFARPTLPAGTTLAVSAECTGAFAPLAKYRAQVRHGDLLLVDATIGIYTLGPVPA